MSQWIPTALHNHQACDGGCSCNQTPIPPRPSRRPEQPYLDAWALKRTFFAWPLAIYPPKETESGLSLSGPHGRSKQAVMSDERRRRASPDPPAAVHAA